MLGLRYVGLHDLRQAGVYEPEQRTEAVGFPGGELGAVPVAAVHPGVQGVAVAADHGDGVAVRVRYGRGDRDAESLEAFGGPVLAGDGLAVAVQVVLEEVFAAGGGEPVAAVQQALGDAFAGERLTGGRVAAQQGADGWGCR